MVTTGYADTFGRTVSGGLGTATSGQVYTLFGTASQFNVAPNFATIAPTTNGDKFGYIDNQTTDVDITGQVSMNAIPATALATVGFVAKFSSISNYYNATMMVAAGGAISLRFSKVVGGGLSTITTVATGLTYVANTVYNLRVSIRWSQALQTNILQSKLWVVGSVQPTGWGVSTTDNSLNQYTTFGTSVGIMGRDEQAAPSVTLKIQNVATTTYSLPIPATTDPMCYDPASSFPKQTALESLADATDAVMATLDPLAALAGLFPRVRLSTTNTVVSSTNVPWSAVEFNVNTPTNLAYDNSSAWLGPGIWLATFEMALVQAASDYIYANFFAVNEPASSAVFDSFRSNPAHTGDQGVGGSVHMSKLVLSTDPVTPVRLGVGLSMNSGGTYTASYAALTAIKISDYFA